MQTYAGYPPGVTDAALGTPEPESSYLGDCECGCGRSVESGYEHYRDAAGGYYYSLECVLAHLEIEHVG